MKKIAWIGTGVMGAPMALHLAQAGYEVKAFNRTFDKAKKLEPQVTAVSTIKDAVEDADIVFTIVGYPKDVEETYLEVFKHIQPKTLCIDMTTSSPTLAQKLAVLAKEAGFRMLDAPVTGGDLGAINGTLSIMVGGNETDYNEVLPILNHLGKTINYMGESGNGQHAKLANQTAIAGAIAATAEALTYAKLKGLNLDTMLDVIVGGSANSWQAANNGPKMIKNDDRPGFFIKHFLKDLSLVLEEKEGLRLPILENVTTIYQTMVDAGLGDTGTQNIFNYYLDKLK